MPQIDARVGTVLEGAYRITRLIGVGGMGRGVRGGAASPPLNKRVAIKLMARDLAANQEALTPLHREPRSRHTSYTPIW